MVFLYFTWIYLLQDLIRKLEKNLFLQNCTCNFSFFSNWYWCVCTSSQLLSSYHFVVQEFLCFLIKLLILPLKYLFCHSWHTFHCFPWAEVGISLYDLLPLHRVVGGERGTSVIFQCHWERMWLKGTPPSTDWDIVLREGGRKGYLFNY